ncbi:hypothetical protein D4S03_00825 [bacterium]|nr:MAG: hypothetical protein D4S03_00825 [bacterium]
MWFLLLAQLVLCGNEAERGCPPRGAVVFSSVSGISVKRSRGAKKDMATADLEHLINEKSSAY